MFSGTFITAHNAFDILGFLIALRSTALGTIRLRAGRRTLLHQIPWDELFVVEHRIVCCRAAAAAAAGCTAITQARWQLGHFFDFGRQHRWQMRAHRVAPHRWWWLCDGQAHTPWETQFEGTQIGGGGPTGIEESRWRRRRGAHDAPAVNTQRIVGNNIAGLDPGVGANAKTKIPWLNYFDRWCAPQPVRTIDTRAPPIICISFFLTSIWWTLNWKSFLQDCSNSSIAVQLSLYACTKNQISHQLISFIYKLHQTVSQHQLQKQWIAFTTFLSRQTKQFWFWCT